jgi:endonuclease YncB( thermonuclease family)
MGRPSNLQQRSRAAEQLPAREMDDLISRRSRLMMAPAGAREVATAIAAATHQLRIRLLNFSKVGQNGLSVSRRRLLHAFRSMPTADTARVSWSNLQAGYWRVLGQHGRRLAEIQPRTIVALASALIVAAAIAFGWNYLNSRRLTDKLNEAKKAETVPPKMEQARVAPKVPDSILSQGWTSLEEAYQSYDVRVAPDGTLRTTDGTIRLYGITMPTRSQVCTYRNGERWACGQRAYIALLNFVGSTTIACRIKDTEQPDLFACRLAGIDIGEWMLREGWAYLADGLKDRDYVGAAQAGVMARLGVWADAPPPGRSP